MSFGVLAVIVCAGLGGPLLAIGQRGLVPVVVGELAAGVVVGKTGMHWVDANGPTTAFLSNVGFAMVMFTAGMHVPIRQPGIVRGLRRGAVAAIFVLSYLVRGGGAILLAALITIALRPARVALFVRTRTAAPPAEQP